MKIRLSKNYFVEGILLKEGSILNVTTDSELLEMAKSWSDIRRDLTDEQYIRHEHLLKLFYYKGQTHYDENFSGWIDSAKKGLVTAKLKNTNKYPDAEKIYETIWLTIEDSFDDYLEATVEDLNYEYKNFEKITDLQFKEVYAFIQNYNLWASEELAKKGNVTKSEVVSKIKELLNLK